MDETPNVLNLVKPKKEVQKNDYDIVNKDTVYKLDLEHHGNGMLVKYYVDMELPEDVPHFNFLLQGLEIHTKDNKARNLVTRVFVVVKWWEKPFITLEKKIERELRKIRKQFERYFRRLEREEKIKQNYGL